MTWGCPSCQSLHFPNFPHRINLSVSWAHTPTPGGLVAWTQNQLWYYNCAVLQKAAQLPKSCESPWSGPPTFSLPLGCTFHLDFCFWSFSKLHCSYTSIEPLPLLIQTLNLTHKCDYLAWPQTSPIVMDLLMVTGLWFTLVTTSRPESPLLTEFLSQLHVVTFTITIDLSGDLGSWLTLAATPGPALLHLLRCPLLRFPDKIMLIVGRVGYSIIVQLTCFLGKLSNDAIRRKENTPF